MAKKSDDYNFVFVHILDGKEVTREEIIQHIIKKYPKKKPACSGDN